jgi:hypothetical protein
MKNSDGVKRTFSNHRQWRDFIASVHESVDHPSAVTYPSVIGAMRMGRRLNISSQSSSARREFEAVGT